MYKRQDYGRSIATLAGNLLYTQRDYLDPIPRQQIRLKMCIRDRVVVGYGAQKKASLTSSISQIKGDEAFKNKGIANAGMRWLQRTWD